MKATVILLLALSFAQCTKSQSASVERLKIMASKGQEYATTNGMNEQFILLADMSVHSGKNRIFLWDTKLDTIVLSGLVSHGCGQRPWGGDYSKTEPVFSNTPESHCSSLGRYKIGKRGFSNWGIHVNYKLHGLDSSNSNAYRRTIVLHSWQDVPDQECYPFGAPEGWGCPAVSNELLKKLDPILNTQVKPVLFWQFE